MFKHMLLGLGAASLLVVATAMPVQAIHSPGDPLPPSFIVTGNNNAWEWVWVSPCPDTASSTCSFGTQNYGFVAPVNDAQWTESFTNFTDVYNKFTVNGTTDEKCAVHYFSKDQTECSPGDLLQGAIWKAPLKIIEGHTTGIADPSNSPSADVLWVRARVGPGPDPNNGSVPEPSSLILLGAGLLGLAVWRWKHAA